MPIRGWIFVKINLVYTQNKSPMLVISIKFGHIE